jgi:hypothetical protein
MKIIQCKTDAQYLELEAKAAKFMGIPKPWMPAYTAPPGETDRKFIVIPEVAHLFEDQTVVEGEMPPPPDPPEPPEPSEQEGD